MTDPKLVECERLLAAAEAKIARLLQRIADLEAAEPVSAVMQSQVDDVIGGIGDCEIPSHMDPRRHAIHQCLIAAILDNARLRERFVALGAHVGRYATCSCPGTTCPLLDAIEEHDRAHNPPKDAPDAKEDEHD